jgi:hypothetical protein
LFVCLIADGDGKTGGAAAPAAKADSGAPALDDGLNVPKSTCTGNKKALLIGINYPGTKAELRGCINDVANVKEKLLGRFKFPTDKEHMRVLTDDGKGDAQPTRANMIAGFKWLLENAKANDSLFPSKFGFPTDAESSHGRSAGRERADASKHSHSLRVHLAHRRRSKTIRCFSLLIGNRADFDRAMRHYRNRQPTQTSSPPPPIDRLIIKLSSETEPRRLDVAD